MVTGTRLLLAALLFLSLACRPSSPQELRAEGDTMGTQWSLIWYPANTAQTEIPTMIQQRLDALEGMLTNWRADSIVERFNASKETTWQTVPSELAEIVSFAQELSQQTGGTFDITAAPLIDLWGFGARGRVSIPPSHEAILSAKAHCGWQKLQVQIHPPALKKADSEVKINVSALAEGYALKDLVGLLHEMGIRNFILDIGGEVHASGSKKDGTPWKIGIQNPSDPGKAALISLSLQDQTLATSGVYRQFFPYEGRHYAHVINAKIGQPVQHSLDSVSVISQDALHADGWATALLTMDPTESRALAERLSIRVYFLERKPLPSTR